MFERLMTWLGFSRTEDLVLVGRNADYAFDKLAVVEPQLDAAKDRLSFLAAENVRLRAEVAGHVRVIGVLMDEVGERVPA